MPRVLFFAIVVCLSCLNQAWAQEDVRPTLRFESGEEVSGRSGVKAIIPENWSGVLPRGVELFLLVPNDGSNGEIYISVRKKINQSQREANWRAGLDLGNGNVLKSDGEIFERQGGGLATNLILTENTSDRKAYVELNCGTEYCLTATLLSAPQDFDRLKKVLFGFLDSVEWGEPGSFEPYVDFNWNEFLTGKHLLNHDYVPNGKAQNDIWLCPDGTFTTKLKRSGIAKEQAREYKGTKTGTWETNSIGSKGILVLKYKKLPLLEVSLEIREEKIYLNDKRHFAIKATECGPQ